MENKITQKEKLLIADLLELAANEFGNHGSNDWDFPNNWTQKEKIDFCKAYHEWNGTPEDFDEKHLVLPNFAVMGFFAHKLYQSYI